MNNLVDWIMTIKESGDIPCKCPKCGNKWSYSGEKRGKEWVTCPKSTGCGLKSRLDRMRLDRE